MTKVNPDISNMKFSVKQLAPECWKVYLDGVIIRIHLRPNKFKSRRLAREFRDKIKSGEIQLRFMTQLTITTKNYDQI